VRIRPKVNAAAVDKDHILKGFYVPHIVVAHLGSNSICMFDLLTYALQ
jgi:hypothetical protein